MQQPPKPNAFAIPARSSIAIKMQRDAKNAQHRTLPQSYIHIYPSADALKRQRIAKASI